ncbi:MAG: hypothetical protein KME07_18415 [Pegethrix bostrychoides GSE-TBD4-15B]|jgi:hypothetical protein|uniref:Uncharacterized protein n=1 Tax=Pegethrix bostrychoides GSE-TBD4-15B TaxID=2839662 RepID=A0A951PD73_9CYAN|nr:hypothetical protein [Pegethrix bostrychoides GSE-TBD4-15B]
MFKLPARARFKSDLVCLRFSAAAKLAGFSLVGLLIGLPVGSGKLAVAQTDPSTGYTGVQIPYSSITPVNGRITIHFINETGSAIDYQVIDDTEYRSLPGRSQMTLENLTTPTTFTFRRADNGFLQVTIQPDSPKAGTLTMRVRETPDFAADRTSVYVDQRGSVFLN